MAEEHKETVVKSEGEQVEVSDRGLFSFIGKKEEEKSTEEVLVTGVENVHIEEAEKIEDKKEEEEKKEGLLEKLQRSHSSSSSSSSAPTSLAQPGQSSLFIHLSTTMLFSALSVLLLPLLARAQYGGPPAGNSGSGTSSASAAAAAPSAPPSNGTAINIDVGAGGKFVYNPANITASNGTIVTFFFPSGSIPHSVTQSSFAQPCTYLAAANGSSGGFDSGLQNSVQFSINITNDQEPIWFHCKTPTHCGLGMVGSINAPASGNTFSAFQAAAVAIGSSETTETNTGAVTGGVGAIATAAPAATFAASGSSSPSSSSAGRTAASGGLALFAVAVSMLLA